MLGAAKPFTPRRGERYGLFGLGLVLAVIAFFVTMSIGPLQYHHARDAELRTTVSAYEKTGVLLVKETGSGNQIVKLNTSAPLEPAALDDDPGSFVLASVVARIMGTSDPYKAITLVQAGFVAVPMLWLPWTMAALFRRTRAGWAAVALPVVAPLLKAAPKALLGTDYGTAVPGGIPVYALYGLASSALFAALSLVLLFITRRRSWPGLATGVVVFGVLAGGCVLMRSWSGIGVVLGVAVFVALHTRGWRRLLVGVAAAAAGMAIMVASQAGVMSVIDAQRSQVTGMDVGALPGAHTTWHPMYLGLSYSDQLSVKPSVLGIVWSDAFGWDKARQVDPDVIIASPEYDAIMKDLYLAEVREHPKTVALMYVEKALETFRQNAGVLGVVLAGLVLLWRRPSTGPVLRRVSLVMLPALAYGFTPPTLVMPLRYYFLELSAVSGVLLVAVLAAVAAATARRSRPGEECAEEECGPGCRVWDEADDDVELSIVVPTHSGSVAVTERLITLGEGLDDEDEIIVVEHGSDDEAWERLGDLASRWPTAGPDLRLLRSGSGLGRALSHGAAHSRGRRCLFGADNAPVDLEAFDHARAAPVLIGSSARPDSRILLLLRRLLLGSPLGDSRSAVSVDGTWVRAFAAHARQRGLLWTTELVTAARAQELPVRELPAAGTDDPDRVVRTRSSSVALAAFDILGLAIRRPRLARRSWPLGQNSSDHRAVVGAGRRG